MHALTMMSQCSQPIVFLPFFGGWVVEGLLKEFIKNSHFGCVFVYLEADT